MIRLRLFRSINFFYTLQLALVGLIALELLPRYWALVLGGLAVAWILLNPLEKSTFFFIRSIPFFIALPFVSYFDNFNLWRIVALIMALKLIYQYKRELIEWTKEIAINPRRHRIAFAIILLFVLAILSLLKAADLFIGIKRIIYFANLLIVPFAVYFLLGKQKITAQNIMKNMAIPAILIMIIGFVQLISTYLMTPDEFLRFWALKIQSGFYGTQWSHIALNANTWLAYFGNQLSLRMFSTFPDSHTFPMFLILSLPALLFTFGKKSKEFKPMAYGLQIVLLPILLVIILSGTRGIWIAVFGPIFFLFWFFRQKYSRNIFKQLTVILVIFFLLFALAFPIFSSSQFQLEKVSGNLLKERLRSIIDFGETSNSGRIYIWKKTLKSIEQSPLLGVGIGNFATVLKQAPDAARAGASAHNLYLNVFAEIGIIGGLLFIYLLYLIWDSGIKVIRRMKGISFDILRLTFYILFSFSWIFLYSMTDAALFDERTFLVFGISAAVVLFLVKNTPQSTRIKHANY